MKYCPRLLVKKICLFAFIDDNASYFLAYDLADTKEHHKADDLLIRTKEAIDKSLKHFTTDELLAYTKSSKRVFGKDTLHHAHIYLKGNKNNNTMNALTEHSEIVKLPLEL